MKKVKKSVLLLLLVLSLMTLLDVNALVPENQQYERAKKLEEKLQNYPIPKHAIELKILSSFPSDALVHKDILLNKPVCIANDSSGDIYVTDSDENRILRFDSSGDFKLQIGQKGQGPGDLSYPKEIVITKDDTLMVSEVGNGRVQFLNKEGQYLKSFRIFKGYSSWIVNDKDLIFAIPLIGRRDRDSKLIEVLSDRGQVLSSFGNPLDIEYGRGMFNLAKIAKNKIGELFVAFTFVPIVRKYSQEGELLAEFEIDNVLLKEFGKFNLSNQALLKKGKKGVYRALIIAVRGSDNGFYILCKSRRVEILEFDRSGKQKAFYWYMPEAEDYVPRDFLVQNKSNNKIFYVLQTSPEAKIDVFTEIR